MITLTFVVVAAQLAAPAAHTVTAQEAAERVSECGFGPVTARYEPDLQEDVLVARSATSPTDEQLKCAYNVVGFYYTLDLPSNVQSRFDALLGAIASAAWRAQAHDWLSAHRLLNLVPKYQNGVTDDGAFTRQVEALCGPQAKGAFQSKYGFHVLSPAWIARKPKPPSDQVFSCLFNVTEEAGFSLSFIGNKYPGR